MITKIYPTYAAFLSREDKRENGVSQKFADLHPNWEKENESNKGCWNCSNCYDRSNCSGLKDIAP